MALFHIVKISPFKHAKNNCIYFNNLKGDTLPIRKTTFCQNDNQIYLNFKPMVLGCGNLTGQYLKHLLYIIELCLKTVSTYPQTVEKHVHVCPGSLCSQGRINADFNFSAVSFSLTAYGNTGCQVSKEGIKNKITYSKENHCIGKQTWHLVGKKLGFILENKLF